MICFLSFSPSSHRFYSSVHLQAITMAIATSITITITIVRNCMKNCALVSSSNHFLLFLNPHAPSPFFLLLFFLSFLPSTFLFRLLSTPFSIQLSILKAFNIVSSSAITKAIATTITIAISIIIKCIVMGQI